MDEPHRSAKVTELTAHPDASTDVEAKPTFDTGAVLRRPGALPST